MVIDVCGRTEIEAEIGEYWVRSPIQSFDCRLGVPLYNTRRILIHVAEERMRQSKAMVDSESGG